jgi:hypothetical protein
LKAVTYQIRANFDNPLIKHVSDPKAIPRGRKDPHPNLFRGEESSAVQGNQQGVVDRAKSRQIALLVQGIANLGHDRVHRFRRHRIQQIANLVIAGNLMHPEQRRGIVSRQLLLHPDLAIEEGRTLREKHGEGRQGRIFIS